MVRVKTLFIFAVLLGAPQSAWPYAMEIHEALTQRAFTDSAWLLRSGNVRTATISDLNAFRLWFYGKVAKHPDSAISQRFVKQFPTVKQFTARRFREFLAFNVLPHKRIYGIDRVERTRKMSTRHVLSAGASAPDRDGRNQDRYMIDPKTLKPLKTDSGQRIPIDPATLNMGNLTGLSSQAHAHYGLPNTIELSDDPDVLKSDPKRFAVKAGYGNGPILTLAAEMAQMHADLSLMAALWGGKGAPYLTAAFSGQAFHYLQDVGNQIHTVQVGNFGFFLDAKLQYWWRALITGGGYWAQLLPFTKIGVGILKNHHVLIEQLTALRFKEAVQSKDATGPIATAMTTLAADEAAFSAELDSRLAKQDAPIDFAETITRTLIDASAPEGPKAYEYAREIACGRLGLYGYSVPDDTDSRRVNYDELVCDRDDVEVASKLNALYELQAVAFRRVTTAMRRYDKELASLAGQADSEKLLNQLISRFVTERLDLMDASATRRADYLANASATGEKGEKAAGWLIGELVLVLLIGFFFWWRGRRHPSTNTDSVSKDTQVETEGKEEIAGESNASSDRSDANETTD